jgi:hypothetical protein
MLQALRFRSWIAGKDAWAHAFFSMESCAALTALETLTIIDFALSLNANNH